MKKFLFGLFALGLMTSCVKEAFVVETQQNTPDFVVTATVEETPATRTQLSYDNGYKTVWSAGDAINVNNMLGSYKFVLVKGANTPNAEFANDPTYSGVSAGTEDGNTFPGSGMVAVYPFNANVTSTMEGKDVVINTEIPASQTFSAGSFGQNASPMVAYNVAGLPQFSFKNVGTVFCMPLFGEGTIVSAKLESASGVKIAGAATVTAVAENDYVPSTTVTEAGVSVITLSCGEGVELSAEPVKFYFVLAPGTYEENDLVVTFTNSYGDFFQTTIPATLEYKRSEINTFKAREFEAQGTEELDLWVKAKAGAYMTAQRIIPSVSDVNIEEWVRNLSEQENPRALIEEAITCILLKNYEAAYDVLGGIPGFVREYQTFHAVGSYLLKVDFTGMSYATSFLDKIDNVKDIYSLIEFMEDFEKEYKASNLTDQMNSAVGNFSQYFDKFLDFFVNGNLKGEDPDYSTAIEAYIGKVIENLNTTINSANTTISTIEAIRALSANAFDSQYQSIVAYRDAAVALKTDLTDNQANYPTKESVEEAVNALPTIDIIEGTHVANQEKRDELEAELTQLKAELATLKADLETLKKNNPEYVTLDEQLQKLEKEFEEYKKRADVQQYLKELNDVPWYNISGTKKVKEKYPEISAKVDDYEKQINTLNAKLLIYNLVASDIRNKNAAILAKEAAITAKELEIGTLDFTETGFKFSPMDLLTGADDAYNGLKDEIDNNLSIELSGAQKALIETLRKEIANFNVIEEFKLLVKKQENGEELTYIEQWTMRFITSIFSENNQAIMDGVKQTLRTLVETIEEAAKGVVNGENVTAKQAAITLAKNEALKQARLDAWDRVEALYNKTNEDNIANLGNGAWGLFKRVLGWKECVELFEQLKMTQVYNALNDLVKIVEEVVRYDEGDYLFDIPNTNDYQENVDWWIQTYSEEF